MLFAKTNLKIPVLDEIGKIESKTTVQSIDELKKIRNTKLNMAFKATTKFFKMCIRDRDWTAISTNGT